MDKLQWFKFSYADWRMGKIQRCPEITQARFMNLCCLYWSKESNLSIEDAQIEIDKEHLDILISKKIVEVEDDYITIKFLDEQLLDISETSREKKQSGKLGNLKRWHKELYDKVVKSELSVNDAYAIVKQSHTDSTPIAPQSQSVAEKSRQDEIREEKKRKDNNKPTAFNFRNSFLELGVDNDILNDWLTVRKKKRSVNSETAFNMFIKEVGKSKLTVSEAVEMCAGRSWASYKVEYDKSNDKSVKSFDPHARATVNIN